MKKFIKAVLYTIKTIAVMALDGVLVSGMMLIVIPILSIVAAIGDRISLIEAYYRLVTNFTTGIVKGLMGD